jgi:hypothetical protein
MRRIMISRVAEIVDDVVTDAFFNDAPPLILHIYSSSSYYAARGSDRRIKRCIHEDGSSPVGRASANSPRMMLGSHARVESKSVTLEMPVMPNIILRSLMLLLDE